MSNEVDEPESQALHPATLVRAGQLDQALVINLLTVGQIKFCQVVEHRDSFDKSQIGDLDCVPDAQLLQGLPRPAANLQ